jgi:hypothetical protein
MKTTFLRILAADDKAAALLRTVREGGDERFVVDPVRFLAVPRSPFVYWVSDSIRALYGSFDPFESGQRTARLGASSKNDFRYLRLFWENPRPLGALKSKKCAYPFAKGGVFSVFYASFPLQIFWGDNGKEIEADLLQRYPYLGTSADFVLHRNNPYTSPGLTWTYATTLPFSIRALPAGCIFSHGGPAAFVPANDLLPTLALMSSLVFRFLVSLSVGLASAGRKNYDVGIVQRIPTPFLKREDRESLAELAGHAWAIRRALDTRAETSHAFTLPALLQVPGSEISARAGAWLARVRTADSDLTGIRAEIDDRCFVLYGIDEADRHAIINGFGTRGSDETFSDSATDTDSDDAGEDIDENESTADATGLAAELVSWAIGVAFGRFDIRLATGTRSMPTAPEPFDPLPACSPGLLTGEGGLPLDSPPVGYPLDFPVTGVLVDDPGHVHDLPIAARAVFEVVFGADADKWWNDAAALLDPKSHDLRAWFVGSFFEHHLKRYSKSRRRAPIVWQLGKSSGRYSVWLYAQRLTRDTFFQLHNELIGPKLTHEERQLTSLIQNAGGSPSASMRKEIAVQEAFVEELREMLDEVKRVAPLWNPNLEDGVVLTMAPLWRLVPQHKPWQKELKAKWEEICSGKYDWADIAMRLWPERVVPKCAIDRSLAIAHGLEEVFWIEDGNGKWTAKKTSTRPVDELVRERTSLAVKAALKGLLEAPVTGSDGGSSGRRRAVASKGK